MMDKNEIIERLGEIAKHAIHTIGEEPFIMSLDDGTAVREAIKIIQQSQPQSHWIPCDKGEPNEDMECWVTVKTTDALYRGNFTRRYGERRDKGFITSGGFMWWNTALAWMPIYEPEPYREG